MNKDAVTQQYQVEAAQKLVPEGYKQTEVGVIPEDWEAKILSSLLTEPPKYGINAAAVPLAGTLPVYIRITDISEDGYFQPTEKVGVDNPFSHLYQLKEGDIVLARTGASVGKSYLYNKADGPLVYAGFLIKIQPDKSKLVSGFLSQFLQAERYWNWVTVNSMRSGQPGINGNEYGGLLVPCPSIKEQAAIANALSDVDALLSELEKLIAKKQAIKTATMQQLLTGRTRLPPFSFKESAHHPDGSKKGYKQSELGEIPEDWEVCKLGEQALFVGSGKTSTKSRGEYPLYGSTGLIGSCSTPEYEGDAILVARVGANAGSLNFVSGQYGVSDNTIIVRLKLENIIQFFKYWLIRKNLNTLVFGSGQPLITGTQLKELSLALPSKAEQTAIATILSDMDAEIQALEYRLSKTRQIKQGMMQQLLTGKTRLPVEHSA